MSNYSVKTYYFDQVALDCFSVIIQSSDWHVCNEKSRNLWCNEKKGFYGTGMANKNNDKYKVSRTGLLGEMAFAKVFELSVDLEYRKYGDSGKDFTLGPGKTIDVKTATTLQPYRSGLVRVRNEQGKNIPLNSDIYVFGFIKNESLHKKTATVVLVGYEMKENMLNITPVLGRKNGSKHMNCEVKYCNLKPMSLLLRAHEKFLMKSPPSITTPPNKTKKGQ
jgi:hypothetical protein